MAAAAQGGAGGDGAAVRHGVEARHLLVPAAAGRADLAGLVDDVTRRFGALGASASAAVQLLNAADVGTLDVSRSLHDTLRDSLRC